MKKATSGGSLQHNENRNNSSKNLLGQASFLLEQQSTRSVNIFKDYDIVSSFKHVSDVETYDAISLLNGTECRISLVPYTQENYWKLIKIQTLQSPYLLKYSRIEVIGDMILLEELRKKPLVDIFEQLNPDSDYTSREILEEETIQAIISDVLQGLHTIHRAGYIHTCVRAKSIFINSEGMALLGNLHMIRKCNELSVNECLAHMSPEMVAQLPDLMLSKRDKHLLIFDGLSQGFAYKSDCWGIGMLVYELVALMDVDELFDGMFEGISPNDLAGIILKKTFPSLHVLEPWLNRTPGLSRIIKDFVRRCLHSDPGVRWSVAMLFNAHPFLKTPGPLKADRTLLR